MRDEENPEDGRCDKCDSRVGNAHLNKAGLCESCAVDALDAALSAKSREAEGYRAALEEIAQSAPLERPDLESAREGRNGGDIEDAAYADGKWQLAQIARAALAGDGAAKDTPAPEPFEVPDGWTRGRDLGDGTPTFYHCPTFEHRCVPAEGGRMVTCACGARWTIPAQERGGEA